MKKSMKKEFEQDFSKLIRPVSKIPTTFSEKAADALTKVIGSWGFILIFISFLVIWIILNSIWIVFGKNWDPYPFILLNLTLSCLAALQAPLILMSQNRQNKRDRLRAQYDYTVDRKAEREIEGLQREIREIKSLLLRKKKLNFL